MISLFPLSTKGCAVMRVCYKPLTPQRIHLSIGWWHETSCNSDFITLATEKKIDLVQLKNLNVTLTVDARFFHFLVFLKNYDGRRLKHKLEFLCRQCCSYLAHIELILNFLESSISFHFSVQFIRLVISITDKRTMTIEAQYPNVFVILLLPLMSSLCRIVFRFYDYITREHTLTFEITFTWRTEIFYRMS